MTSNPFFSYSDGHLHTQLVLGGRFFFRTREEVEVYQEKRRVEEVLVGTVWLGSCHILASFSAAAVDVASPNVLHCASYASGSNPPPSATTKSTIKSKKITKLI